MKAKLAHCIVLLFVLVFVARASNSTGACKATGPVLTGTDGQPVWLTSEELVASATHCVAPLMPPLARQAQIEGHVVLNLLVDERGKVACIRPVNGHPMLVRSAIDAAKQWTFRPRKQHGKTVSFYGHLQFHFSSGEVSKTENPCTVAHW